MLSAQEASIVLCMTPRQCALIICGLGDIVDQKLLTDASNADLEVIIRYLDELVAFYIPEYHSVLLD